MLVGTSGDGTPVNLTVVTDANGNYTFTNVAPGTYTVKFTKPTGYNGSPKDAGTNDALDSDADPITGQTAPVTVVSGTDNTTVDAGFNKPAPVYGSVGDLIFCDKNANGIQDAGEPGLAGVSVMLVGMDVNGQTVLLSTTTDANGKYNFGNLLAGTYTVMIIKPTGYNSSPKDAGTNDAIDSDFDAQGKSNTFTLTAGQNINTIDAGLFQYACIGDLVFDDKNNNGIQDAGEPGIAGATVVLNGIVNGVPVTQVTTTNANGNYKFINLLPGTYSVTFNKPTGFNPSPANQGADDNLDSDANAAGTTQTITLLAGDNNTSLDAGFNKPAPVLITIGDFVFLDCNKNGLQDVGELGIANIPVKLKDAAGTQIATTTTNASGAYSFANITAGSYNVCFSLPAGTGFVFTTKDAGANANDTKDSDAGANGETGLINFTANNSTIDAGIIDTQAPVLNNVPANATVECNAIPAVPTNITATDNYTTAPTITYTTSTTTSTPGQYLLKRIWTATDKCGNKTTATQTICVKDTQVPVFITKPVDMTVECSNIPQPLYPEVKDNCDTKVPITLSVQIIPGSCSDSYTIKRTWTAADKAGNICTHAQYIKVQDTTAPVITGAPQDITIQCGQAIPEPPAPGVVKATDNCDKDVTLTFSETIFPGNCAGKGVIKCQWTAVDNCGNVTIKIWTITIQGGVSSLIQNTNNRLEATPAQTRENATNVKFTNDDIKVFPNPTNGEVTITIGDVPATKLNIVNEIGQVIYSKDQPARQEQVNLSNGKKGLYTVQVITNDSVLTKKLIVIE
jgi:SdrD B-like domain/Secretion system C-terminal sorting domain